MKTTTVPYRYQHFQRRVALKTAVAGAGPKPGEQFPDFDLPTVDGGRVRKEDFAGARPFLLTIASATCPMTASASPILKGLHERFGERVAFLSLYVRERHPGDQICQAENIDEKIENARLYQKRDRLPWTVAVDGLDGEVHEQLGRHPNAVYLVDGEGAVAYRSRYSNVERPLARALEAMNEGKRPPYGDDRPRVAPLLRGIGSLSETLHAAGPDAERDAMRQTPPMYVLGKIAGAFRPLPPLGRGIAAVGVVTVATGLLARAIFRRRVPRG